MNLHLRPRQFLFLYNSLKKYERDFLTEEEEEMYFELMNLCEEYIVNAFEDVAAKAQLTGFNKWLKSETNKIKELEEELQNIKMNVPQEELVSKFKPVVNNKKITGKAKGRPKKL